MKLRAGLVAIALLASVSNLATAQLAQRTDPGTSTTKPAPHRTVGAVWRKSSTRASAIAAVCDVVDRVMTGGPKA